MKTENEDFDDEEMDECDLYQQYIDGRFDCEAEDTEYEKRVKELLSKDGDRFEVELKQIHYNFKPILINKYDIGKDVFTTGNYGIRSEFYWNKQQEKKLYRGLGKGVMDKIKAVSYYLKTIGYTHEQAEEYFTGLAELISKVSSSEKYTIIINRIWNEEFNRQYNTVKFCKKEIDYIKSFSLNTGRVLFMLLCVRKYTGHSWFQVDASWISKAYDNCIQNAYKIIYKLNNDKIIISRDCQKYKRVGTSNRKMRLMLNYEAYSFNPEIYDMYDGNDVVEFNYLGDMKTLFDYTTNRYSMKHYGFCSKCGKIFIKSSSKSRQVVCSGCKSKDKQVNISNGEDNFKNTNNGIIHNEKNEKKQLPKRKKYTGSKIMDIETDAVYVEFVAQQLVDRGYSATLSDDETYWIFEYNSWAKWNYYVDKAMNEYIKHLVEIEKN